MYALATYLLRTANVGTFNAIAELDLSFTQIKALCALEADGEERSVKALADSLGRLARRDEPRGRRALRARLRASARRTRRTAG